MKHTGGGNIPTQKTSGNFTGGNDTKRVGMSTQVSSERSLKADLDVVFDRLEEQEAAAEEDKRFGESTGVMSV